MIVAASPQRVFDEDLARLNRMVCNHPGAVVTLDGGGVWIDPSRLPDELISAYGGLLRYGYANGLLATPASSGGSSPGSVTGAACSRDRGTVGA